MSNIELIKKYYSFNNFTDVEFVSNLIDDAIELDWKSTVGSFIYNKKDILKLTQELFVNYATIKFEILNIFGTEDEIAVRLNIIATTIENPDEEMLIANIMSIWIFENNKIIKGFQFSTTN